MNKAYRIGFLAGDSSVGTGKVLLNSIQRAAADYGAHFFSFSGGAARPREVDKETLRKGARDLFRFINKTNLDGLIVWATSLRYFFLLEEVEEFFSVHHELKIVSLSSPISGAPLISIDNHQGISQIMSHLVKIHGFNKIAFVRALESHPYAKDRFESYKDSLKKYNLPYHEILVTPPANFSYETGKRAVEILLDERKLAPGIDVQAVVNASDYLAYGMMNELNRRKIRVPQELVVTGFDDKVEARSASPPLTTVHIDFTDHGRRAFNVLIDLLNGQEVENHHLIKNQLIVRQSCGCFIREVENVSPSACAQEG